MSACSGDVPGTALPAGEYLRPEDGKHTVVALGEGTDVRVRECEAG
jgi:hypothetical protein